MSLVERAKRLLLTPAPEWQVIDAEPTTPAELFAQYVVPLAAIGPIARVVGFSLIGIRTPFTGAVYRVPIGRALVGAVVSYLLALVMVAVLGMIIDALAPYFGGTPNRAQAIKVAVYSSTAVWLAGVFAILPGLGILGILGLYSIYLLYVGLPILMKAPADKAGAYTMVVILVAIVLTVVIGAVGRRMMIGGMM